MIDRNSDYYQARAAAHAGTRDVEARRSHLIARLRLATVIPGAACLIWAMSRGVTVPWVPLGLALIGAFAILAAWHAVVEERVAWFDALHTVNLHRVARIARAWARLPEPPLPIVHDIEHHPYATDLDLFGHASLLQWLGPAATVHGARTLQAWLLAPSSPAAIAARQVAVAELAPADEWRENLAAHGRRANAVRPAELESFLAWAEGPGRLNAPYLRLLRVTVLTITAAIAILAALHATGRVDTGYWLMPMTLGIVLSFVTAGIVHGEFNRALSGQPAFARYAELFLHAVQAPSASAPLAELQQRLSASGLSAPACMRKLNRILGFAQLRAGAGILHFAVQALTLWDFHVFVALDRWRRDVGPHVRDWMATLGELDALAAFAQIKADNPAWATPVVADGATVFDARTLGHPLIPDDRRVANDVVVGPPGTLLLITGSNMSGKSTLLRAIGLNAVLAQAGAPVCPAALSLPAVDLQTSIRVVDSLEHGLSYFMAALARLKRIVDRSNAGGDRRVFYLLDEILQGTNTAERSIAVRGVARHLLASGAIGVMTTHDLGVAGEEPLSSAATLAHFTEIVDEHGGMTFDYQLRPGLATSRNALRLMGLIGIKLE